MSENERVPQSVREAWHRLGEEPRHPADAAVTKDAAQVYDWLRASVR